jgi:uncharacterized protein (TIGR02145 family)
LVKQINTMEKKIIVLVLLLSAVSFAQVGIGTLTPDASAVLDVSSSTKGLLPPRLTTEQRNAMTNPTAGLAIYNSTLDCLEIYNGVRWLNHGSLTSNDVYSPATGQIWMNRNLGAIQAATSSTDFNAYGSLFQWGRAADGHQQINWTSATAGTPTTDLITSTLSDSPLNARFITPLGAPFDWRTSPNDNLWQGVNGTNNPCPSGYRLPTEAEWNAERSSWASQNTAGAFASPLKLTTAGMRANSNGTLTNTGTNGYYWSSTVNAGQSRYLYIAPSPPIGTESLLRSYGFSVRCIKN